jgi:O-antigen ligase
MRGAKLKSTRVESWPSRRNGFGGAGRRSITDDHVAGQQVCHQSFPMSTTTRWLGYGLAAIPLLGAAVPFSINSGRAANVVAALIASMALVGIWLARFVVTGNLVLVRSPLNLPVGSVGLVWVLAFLSSNVFFDPRVAVQLGSAFTFVQVAALTVTFTSLGLLLLGANIGQDLRVSQLATWGLIAVGVVAIVAYYASTEAWLPFLNTNGLFTLWVVTLSYGQALCNHRLPRVIRLGLLGLVAAYLVKAAIFQTGWLSGWMPSVAAVAVVTLLRSRTLSALAALAVAVVGAGFAHRIYEAVVQSQLDEGSDSRLVIWSQAWDLLSQHLLLGTGPVGYAAYYFTLYRGSGASLSTHSNYLDIAAQTGLLGSLAFLWLLFALAITAWQACRRWPDGFAGGYARAAAGGLVGVTIAMALGDWVIPFIYNQGIDGFRYTVHTWVFLGLLAGIATAPVEASGR